MTQIEMTAKTAEEAKGHWVEAKKEEKRKKPKKSLLESIGKGLPALLETAQIGKKVATVGFDWQKPEDVLAKMQEELDELKAEVVGGNSERMSEEMGDFLFSTGQLARHMGVDPEVALLEGNKKFKQRFQMMEEKAQMSGKDLDKMTSGEQQELWCEVKKETR